MNRQVRRRLAWCLTGALILLGAIPVGAQESLGAARDLYAAAAYEDALDVLNRLRGRDRSEGDHRTIEQYRAFCLLALGRAEEAERAIEAVVAAEPSYSPSTTEVSPRIRSAFTDVRRRMLPAIVQQKYAQAKAAFDRKEFDAAADQFKNVLAVFNDPDLGSAGNRPPLSDLLTLSVGFHELAVSAATPPPRTTTAAASGCRAAANAGGRADLWSCRRDRRSAYRDPSISAASYETAIGDGPRPPGDRD